MRGLAKSKLAGSRDDASWRELSRQLNYKAAWAGRTLVVIDPRGAEHEDAFGLGRSTTRSRYGIEAGRADAVGRSSRICGLARAARPCA